MTPLLKLLSFSRYNTVCTEIWFRTKRKKWHKLFIENDNLFWKIKTTALPGTVM